MTAMRSISKLTTSVDQLTGAANMTKAELDTKVAQADAEVVSAQVEQTATEAARDAAGSHATDAETHLATVKAGLTYEAINAILISKALTAEDLFVYDTSLDSDGGAWRKRCRHTSWFNEPLNTATRGGRREFPAVAVIVAENDKVTIYDGDDPSLPMWMEANRRTNKWTWLGYSDARSSSVFALNGILSIGITGASTSRNGITIANFVSDFAFVDDGGDHNAVGIISARNEGVNDGVTVPSSHNILRDAVNDVAMTVLPDAPIDQATGLPVPTIAMATDGGVSVIKDDGTVVSNTLLDRDAGFAMSENGDIFAGRAVGRVFHYLWLRAEWQSGSTSIIEWADSFDPDRPLFGASLSGVFSGNSYDYASITAFEYGGSLVRSQFSDDAPRTNRLIAVQPSTYNTGWMPGDTKGAFLSDTDDTDLVGSGELVTNGTFDTDTSGWSAGNGAALSGDAGRLKVTNGSFGYADHQVTVEVGKTYSFTFEAEAGLGAWEVRLGTPTAPSKYERLTFSPGSGVVTFKAVSTTVVIRLLIYTSTSGDYAFFDNISVKLADADRSVKNNGLIVNGTVTRSPVATGADLVAYSGFSGTNCLTQPYNPDLDFGTGDFCVMGWVLDGTNAGDSFIWIADPAGPGAYIAFQKRAAPDVARIRVQDAAGGYDLVDGQKVINSLNAGTFLCAVRQSGVLKLYEDGRLVGSTSSSRSVSNANAELTIGVNFDRSVSTGSDSKKMALWRISATAPTAEQIAKIYEDERKLFQPGAKCTLYGASDAVTALAHDPKTNLLHVGTSDGRSVFDGLVRIDHTETSVGTAISAVNGLIVEG